MQAKSLIRILIVTLINGKRRRGIGMRWDEPPATSSLAAKHPVLAKDGCCDKHTDRIPSLIPGGRGRHRKRCILFEQRDQALHIGGLPGVDKLVEQYLCFFIC